MKQLEKCVIKRLRTTTDNVVGKNQYGNSKGIFTTRDGKHGKAILTTKVNRNLGFLRRNLNKCPKKVKEQVYCDLVRPRLEYAEAAWDPRLKKDILRLESVQMRAARFVKVEYSHTLGTVSTIYHDLNWDTLEKRRKVLRLTLLHKALHVNMHIALPSYIHTKTRYTRSSLRSRLSSVSTSCNVYKQGFS